jgi:hypothetical protein
MKIKWIVRLLLAIIIGCACTIQAHANCGNDNGNGNGCSSGQVGPQGPAGQQGLQGPSGAQGLAGSPGKDGKDATSHYAGTDVVGGVVVRLLDTKRVQVQAFDDYVFDTVSNRDITQTGHNSTVGARLVFKLGKSWEEELIEKQAAQLTAMEAALSRLEQ